MGDQSYMDFLSDSSPPSSRAILSWEIHQILSFGGTSSNFVSVIKYFIILWKSNARAGKDTWQFCLWWCGPFKIPSSKTLSLSCSKIICASTAFSLYGFPNTSDMIVNNVMEQDTNWQVQSQKEWNCAQTIVGWG